MRKDIISAAIGIALGTIIGIFAINHRAPMTVVATTMDTVPQVEAMEEPAADIREITEGERDLMAAIVYAEAGNQDLDGKRYVASTVLNRVDSDKFPNDITSVIFQPYQFWTKGFPKNFSDIPEECYQAVDLECIEQINTEVLYFRASRYHSFGTPVLQHGNHFFSK